MTIGNTFVAHSSCNSSQGTLSLRQTRRAIGLSGPKDNIRSALNGLSIAQLRNLASKKDVKVRGSVSEGLFESVRTAPSKAKYVNALAKRVSIGEIGKAKTFVPAKPKRRRRRNRGLFDIGF